MLLELVLNRTKKLETYGVVRQNGRGIPSCILQQEAKTKLQLKKLHGTLNVAVLQNDSLCKNFVAISLYDQKPVYLFLNAVDTVS